MIKYLTKPTLLLLILLNILLAQIETVGAKYNQHSRYIDDLRTRSNIWSVGYRNELPSGTRLAVSLGLDNYKFFANGSTNDAMLTSNNQVFAQLEALQKADYLYFKGGIQFYTIEGNVSEVTSGYSKVLHHNTYRMFEFPLGAGFTHTVDDFDLSVGLNKVYFYGTNKKEIIVNNSGAETNLGSSSRQTFHADLGLGAEATILYHLTEDLGIELNLIKYKKKDFSVSISIWGPLRRMFYVN